MLCYKKLYLYVLSMRWKVISYLYVFFHEMESHKYTKTKNPGNNRGLNVCLSSLLCSGLFL